MTDNVDFANLYIEKVLNEVMELTKMKLMNETRLTFLEKANEQLVKNYEQLSEEYQEALNKIDDLIKESDRLRMKRTSKKPELTLNTDTF